MAFELRKTIQQLKNRWTCLSQIGTEVMFPLESDKGLPGSPAEISRLVPGRTVSQTGQDKAAAIEEYLQLPHVFPAHALPKISRKDEFGNRSKRRQNLSWLIARQAYSFFRPRGRICRHGVRVIPIIRYQADITGNRPGRFSPGSMEFHMNCVIAIGLIGAAAANLRPKGMSRTLSAIAIAQILVPVLAFTYRKPDFSPRVAAVFGLDMFFMVLWIISALIFRNAGETANGSSRENPASWSWLTQIKTPRRPGYLLWFRTKHNIETRIQRI